MNKSLIMALVALGVTVQAASLELKPVAEINNSEVRLMDILAGSTDVPKQILETSLGAAPAPGQDRMIYKSTILNAIRDWTGSSDATWSGPSQCKIVRPGQSVGESDIRHYLEIALQKRAESTGKARVVEVSGDKSFLIPTGSTSAEIDLSPTVLNSEWSNAMIRFTQNGRVLAAKSVRFRWALESEVWKSNRSLKVGDALKAEDFSPYTCNVFNESGQVFSGDISQLDAVLARPLVEGGVLTSQHIKNRTLVKRGTPVVVNYHIGMVLVSMNGTALDDGTKGQVISVRNDASKKKIFAKVADEGVLEYVQ